MGDEYEQTDQVRPDKDVDQGAWRGEKKDHVDQKDNVTATASSENQTAALLEPGRGELALPPWRSRSHREATRFSQPSSSGASANGDGHGRREDPETQRNGLCLSESDSLEAR
jgi:hypothetical protein